MRSTKGVRSTTGHQLRTAPIVIRCTPAERQIITEHCARMHRPVPVSQWLRGLALDLADPAPKSTGRAR